MLPQSRICRTGFGLAGHLTEMLKENVGVRLFPEKVPYFEAAVELSKSGFVPGGLYRNKDFYGASVSGTATAFIMDIIFDPQTSGGLLIAIDPTDSKAFEDAARERGADFWVIGEFVSEPRGKILI